MEYSTIMRMSKFVAFSYPKLINNTKTQLYLVKICSKFQREFAYDYDNSALSVLVLVVYLFRQLTCFLFFRLD